MKIASALVIDDDPIFRMVAEDALMSFGAKHVQTAEDGAVGLKFLQQNPDSYQLVLCDLQMPNMDGVDVIRALGRTGFKGALIVVSGEHSSILRAVYSMAQMVGIRILGTLTKPLDNIKLGLMISAGITEESKTTDSVWSRRDLTDAMMGGRIIPFYQPKFDAKKRSISGVEVLARYRDESGNIQLPASMLVSTEQHKLMAELTFVLIEQAIADYLQWREAGFEISMALNFSPLLLTQLDLPDILRKRFEEANINSQKITLEITEDKLLSFEADVLDVLARLRIHGFRLSVDDFGTGATSFEQLQRFPFNELKIDQSFIRAPASDLFARTTLETSSRLAAMLDMPVVAEGVETEDQLKRAISAGANIIQGYLIARPMSSNDLIRYLGLFNRSMNTAA